MYNRTDTELKTTLNQTIQYKNIYFYKESEKTHIAKQLQMIKSL